MIGSITPVAAVADESRERIVLGPTKNLLASVCSHVVLFRKGAEYSKRRYCFVSLVEMRRHGTSAETLTARVLGRTPRVAGVIRDGSWRHL